MNAQLEAILQRLHLLHPKLIDLSLGRVERLLAKLGHPQDQLAPVVHVAGTNGKGSIIAYLRSCLEAMGLRVQCYTSPHLMRFNERVRLAGGLIEDEHLSGLLLECEAANGGQPITFFEITTAAAMLAFAREPADITLLETGLGGRLDAVNVVKRPLLTAITTVSFDHCHYLGRTLFAIAGEKAGILKPGVACVLARQSPKAMAVIKKRAASQKAPLFAEGIDWRTDEANGAMIYKEGSQILRLAMPGLEGAHQIQNAGMAVACLRRLDGFKISESAINHGLANACWPGRLQMLAVGRLSAMLAPGWELWLDGAHNQGGARALAKQAKKWQDQPLFLIIGMKEGKNLKAFLKPLASLAKGACALAIPGDQACLSAGDIVGQARALGLKCQPTDGIEAAIKALSLKTKAPARILICGSLYLAGAALAGNLSP